MLAPLVGLVGVLLAAGLGLFLVSSISRPVLTLTEVMRRLAGKNMSGDIAALARQE